MIIGTIRDLLHAIWLVVTVLISVAAVLGGLALLHMTYTGPPLCFERTIGRHMEQVPCP